MATIEKLVKAFEGLKVFQPMGLTVEDVTKKKDQPPTKKEKTQHCNMVADCICAPNMRSIPDFPKFLGIAMEAFLTLCDDSEADVRMVADECLNRTIKTLLETNLGRLQVELYKEVKKNGPSRTLRAALWRFADMCHLIRPQKCRPYIVNLMPCIGRICRREEEAIQETLSTAMLKICPVLVSFANDAEVKSLLKAFLPNLGSTTAVTRRTAATSLSAMCQYSRSPNFFSKWLLEALMGSLLPASQDYEVPKLLGVIQCLRYLLPLIVNPDVKDEGMKGSFGVMRSEREATVTIEQLLQVREFTTSSPQTERSGKSTYGEGGELVCTKPFPSMPVYFWNDPEGVKYKKAYFSKYPGVWAHGDHCVINPVTGGIVMLGRSDGTLNPNGVRFGSAEIYNVVEAFKEIEDSVCVGQRKKDGTEERVVLFLKMAPGSEFTPEFRTNVKNSIRFALSSRHVPAFILPIADIPYTISGKKVEIAVRQVLMGQEVVQKGALANPKSLDLYYNIPELQNF